MTTLKLAQNAITGWNDRVFTNTDFFHYIEKRRIIYLESDLIDSSGAFLKVRKRDCIVVHKKCPLRFKEWVRWHELAHQICSHPCSGFSINTARKYDYQANIIASVALLPITMIIKYSVSELLENYPSELIKCRYGVYEKYKL